MLSNYPFFPERWITAGIFAFALAFLAVALVQPALWFFAGLSTVTLAAAALSRQQRSIGRASTGLVGT